MFWPNFTQSYLEICQNHIFLKFIHQIGLIGTKICIIFFWKKLNFTGGTLGPLGGNFAPFQASRGTFLKILGQIFTTEHLVLVYYKT